MHEPISRRAALKLIATATVVGAATGIKTSAAETAPTRTPSSQTNRRLEPDS